MRKHGKETRTGKAKRDFSTPETSPRKSHHRPEDQFHVRYFIPMWLWAVPGVVA